MKSKSVEKVFLSLKGRKSTERGTAAVELALLFPILMWVLFGIIECGRFYSATITVTHEAREAVRIMALSPTCVAGGNASATVSTLFTYEIPGVKSGNNKTISRTATMRCGG